MSVSAVSYLYEAVLQGSHGEYKDLRRSDDGEGMPVEMSAGTILYSFETRQLTTSGELIEVFTHKIELPEDCQFTTSFYTKLWSAQAGTTAAGTTAAPTTVITTPTSPTTTVTFPPAAKNVAFNVVIPNPYNTAGGTIPFVTNGSDINNHFNPSSNNFPVVAGGIYYVEICAAVNSGQTANVRLAGSVPQTGVTWDATIQNGVETQCRGCLTVPANGASLSAVLDSGAVYSDPNFPTSLTVFSVQSSMTADAVSRTVFAVGVPNPPTGKNGTLTPLPMTTVIAPADPSVFNAQTATYTCKTTGNYFVSASVGAMVHASTGVQITNNVIPIGLTRSSLLYDGVTTLSRTTILPCTAGSTIQLNLLYGTVVNWDNKNAYNLTTFTIIPYEPANAPTPISWAAYKWYISFSSPPSQISDPFMFSNITLNQGNPISSTNPFLITVPVSGYYYVHLSAGAGLGNPEAGGYKTYTLSLKRGNEVLFAIEHLSSSLDASDVFGHGGIVQMTKGDVIRAVGAAESYYYSSLANYETSFSGMLLYATS